MPAKLILVRPEKRKLTARERRLNLLRDSLKKVILSNKLDEEFFNMAQAGELNLHFRYEEYTDEFGNIHQRMTDPKISAARLIRQLQKNRPNFINMIRLLVDYMDPQFGKQVIPVAQINPFWVHEQDRKKSERRFNEVKKMLEDRFAAKYPERK